MHLTAKLLEKNLRPKTETEKQAETETDG